MNPTGIIRRVDDLGRVVIPKDIREILNVTYGDGFEFFTDTENGTVILKKYMPEHDFTEMLDDLERRFNLATDMVGHKNTKEIKRRFEEIKKLWIDC